MGNRESKINERTEADDTSKVNPSQEELCRLSMVSMYKVSQALQAKIAKQALLFALRAKMVTWSWSGLVYPANWTCPRLLIDLMLLNE